MKQIKQHMLAIGICIGIAFSLTGCYETHYYRHNHHHTRGWYDRHHTPPPAGVNFEVEIHN